MGGMGPIAVITMEVSGQAASSQLSLVTLFYTQWSPP